MTFKKEHCARFRDLEDGEQITSVPDPRAGIRRLQVGDDLVALYFDATRFTPAQARELALGREIVADVEAYAPQEIGARKVYSSGATVRFDGVDGSPEVARRHDAPLDLASPEILPNGFVRAQGLTTRFGVFRYAQRDGSVIKELRPPEEVMDAASLRSFDSIPLTIDHPPAGVDPKNVRSLIHGVSSRPEPHGDHVRADVVIYTEDGAAAVRAGQSKLSYGYDAEIHRTPGVWTNADGSEEPFDTVQRRIRGNHLALVKAARAGDKAALKTDALDGAAQIGEGYPSNANSKGVGRLKKITVAGKEFEIDDVVAAKLDAQEAEKIAAQKERDAAQGKADALEAKIKADVEAKAKEDAKGADQKAIAERLALATLAAPVLKKDLAEVVKLDSTEIVRATVAAAHPKLDLVGKSADYLRAIFDQATTIDAATAAKIAAEGAVRSKAKADGFDLNEKRAKMIADVRDAGRVNK